MSPPRRRGAGDAVAGLGRLEQLVLRGDGLTTTSLQVLTGSVVDVAVLAHWVLPLHGDVARLAGGVAAGYTGLVPEDPAAAAATAVGVLEAGAQHRVLVREVLLRDDGGRAWAASSVVAVLDRLPVAVATALGTTDEPIGRLLARHDVAVRRELLEWGRWPVGPRGRHLHPPAPAGAEVPARRYLMRLVETGRPLAAFTEWFSPALFAGPEPPPRRGAAARAGRRRAGWRP